MGEVSLTTTEFRALSSESRTGILKMLAERNYTLSELSAKTGMAAPTVKQHASILVDSGLVELRDEGRKWKYYALTRKGREILKAGKPQQTSVLIILSTTLIVAALGFVLMFTSLNSQYPALAGGPEYEARNAIEPLNSAAAGPDALGQQAVPAGGDGSSDQTIVAGKRVEGCNPTYDTMMDSNASGMCYAIRSEQECNSTDEYSDVNAIKEADGKADCEWISGNTQK